MAGSSLNFNLISLFPPTYKGRANGMRPDIMELLADLKPVSAFAGGWTTFLTTSSHSFAYLVVITWKATSRRTAGTGAPPLVI